MPRLVMPEPVLTAVEQLHLDPKNPRLPEDKRGADEGELLRFVSTEYAILRIARSIAGHGYFTSEPVIAVREEHRLVVVEGNRRLAAVKVLRSPELIERFALEPRDEWRGLARSESIPDAIPTIVVRTRAEVAPVLGYRHIAGIEPWDPWAKARFIAALVEDDGLPFEEIAELVGDDVSDVREHYRNLRIVRAGERLVPAGAERAKKEFGAFTRAMNSPGLRKHIDATDAVDIRAHSGGVPRRRGPELKELLTWLYGDESRDPIIRDTREVTRLGKVVSTEEGLDAIRHGLSLDDAEMVSGGAKQRLMKRLTAAISNVRGAAQDYPNFRRSRDIQALVQELRDALDQLGRG